MSMKIAWVSILQWPFFDHAPFCVFNTVHNHESIGFNLFNFCCQFVDFQSGNNRINNICIPCLSAFAITILPTVYGYTPPMQPGR